MGEDVMREDGTLPPGWTMPQLGDVVEVIYGKGLPERDRDAAGRVPVYGSNGVVGYHSRAFVDQPCIIIGRKGAAGAVHLCRTPCWPIDTTYFTQPSSELSLEYLYHTLRSLNLQSLDRSTAIPGLNRDDLYAQRIPLPPLREQHRIVAEIEKQFTRLDAGVAALKRVQATLKRYRASVLKAACEGRLAPQDPADEPADRLLARILAERRARWEAEHPGKKYVEPAAPVTDELPGLPVGWCWARAEQLCDFITKGTTPAANKLFSRSGDVPFIKVYNLTDRGYLDFSVNPTFVRRQTHTGELARSRVYPGDVLMNIVGPPLGKVSIVPDQHSEWNINQAIAIFRPQLSYDRRFLCYCLLTEQILAWAIRRAKATAGQFNLTLEICRDLPLPVPPLPEQHRIVAEVERRLSVVAELEATVAANLVRAGRLRQAVLKRAFEGRLVGQDDTNRGSLHGKDS